MQRKRPDSAHLFAALGFGALIAAAILWILEVSR